jgi:23S rRNA (uracil1939-C5)-methyltransferase
MPTPPSPAAHAPLDPPAGATPLCPHFGPCGGCQLQHLAYPAQLALKAAQLRTLLEPTGLTLPELQLHPSPPFAYRNRIRLTLAQIDGRLRAGYIRNPIAAQPSGWPILSAPLAEGVGPRTLSAASWVDRLPSTPPQSSASKPTSFLPIDQCAIAAPVLWRAAQAFLTLANQDAAWLRTSQNRPDQLELFATGDESSLQLTLYLRTRSKGSPSANLTSAFTAFCEALRARIPELTGAGIALLRPASARVARQTETVRPGPAWGASGLNYAVSSPQPATRNLQPAPYWVPRGAFFQINRFLLPELVALVCPDTAARTGALAWDLYAGVGLFSRALARSFSEVVAVEIAEPAVTALASIKQIPFGDDKQERQRDRRQKLGNLRAVKATTLDFLRAAVLQRDRPSFIVLDPPRSGAGPEVCALLARVAAPTVVYVSCSPQTLPRDLKILAASGYTLAELHLLDLFPQTTHLEAAAVLTLGNP